VSSDLTTVTEAARSRHNRVASGYIFIAVISHAIIPTVIGCVGGEDLAF